MTPALSRRCSNQLSYVTEKMGNARLGNSDLPVRSRPLYPLSYRRKMDSVIRFELMGVFTNGFAIRRLQPLGYTEKNCKAFE